MKKLALTAIVLGASLFASVPASADATTPTAHIRITRATNNCTAPNPGPKMFNYPCSYPVPPVRDVALNVNTVTNTVLPDGRVVHLTLKELSNNPRKYKVVAQHRKTPTSEVLSLAEIRVGDNETFSFHFPTSGGTEALFLDIVIN